MEIFIRCLLIASLICIYVTVKRISERLDDNVDDLQDQTDTNFEALGELDKKIRSECDELDAKIEALKKQVAEIPVEQLQAVYDSEKQFQDGLNSILNYYGPRGDDK